MLAVCLLAAARPQDAAAVTNTCTITGSQSGSIVVESGENLSLTGTWYCDLVNIKSGGTLTVGTVGGNNTLRLIASTITITGALSATLRGHAGASNGSFGTGGTGSAGFLYTSPPTTGNPGAAATLGTAGSGPFAGSAGRGYGGGAGGDGGMLESGCDFTAPVGNQQVGGAAGTTAGPANGGDGGYLASGANLDLSIDDSVTAGSGGGSGGGGAGGGGGGGGARQGTGTGGPGATGGNGGTGKDGGPGGGTILLEATFLNVMGASVLSNGGPGSITSTGQGGFTGTSGTGPIGGAPGSPGSGGVNASGSPGGLGSNATRQSGTCPSPIPNFVVTNSGAGGGGSGGGGGGSNGGGGAGGGILLKGHVVTLGGAYSVDNRGYLGAGIATTNGGTVKIRHACPGAPNTSNVQTGRLHVLQLPQVPGETILSPTPNVTSSNITWTWTDPGRYCPGVQYLLTDPNTGGTISTIDHPTLQYLEPVTGMINVPKYRKVKTQDALGTSPLSNGVTAYTFANDPANPQIAWTAQSLVLSWDANNNPSYTRFELILSLSSDFSSPLPQSALVAANLTTPSRVLSGLADGTLHHFRLRAYNGRASDGSGTAFSGFSSGTFLLPLVPALSGTAVSDSEILWSWNSVVGVLGYRLYEANGGPLLTIPDTALLSYSSTSLSPNKAYGTDIESFNALLAGTRSAASFAYTKPRNAQSPAVTAAYLSSATVTWDMNGNPANTVYDFVTGIGAGLAQTVSTTSVAGTTGTIANLFPGTTYYFKVRSVGFGGHMMSFTPAVSTVTLVPAGVSQSSAPLNPYVLPANLKGLWHFDLSGGTLAVDSSALNNTGFLTCGAGCSSTPTYSNGPPDLNQAVSFTGVANGLVRIPHVFPGYAFNEDLTVSAWVKPSFVPQADDTAIVSKGHAGNEDYTLDFLNGKYRFRITDSGPVTDSVVAIATSPRAGQWDHVVGVFNSLTPPASLSLYVNGVLMSSKTTSLSARLNNTCDISVGNKRLADCANPANPYARGFAGSIDELRLIADDLTPQQVLEGYLASFPAVVSPASSGDRVRLTIPPNAFGAAATIFFSSDPVKSPVRPGLNFITEALSGLPTGRTLLSGTLIEITPTVNGNPFTGELGSPAAIAFSYTDDDRDDVIDGTAFHASNVSAYRFDSTVLRWDNLPTGWNSADKRMTGTTTRFSLFGLFGSKPLGTALPEIRVFPSPWRQKSSDRFDAPVLTFDKLPREGKIRIYSLSGEHIIEIAFSGINAGKVAWNGKNSHGEPVASGVYLAYIKESTAGLWRIVKFAIER